VRHTNWGRFAVVRDTARSRSLLTRKKKKKKRGKRRRDREKAPRSASQREALVHRSLWRATKTLGRPFSLKRKKRKGRDRPRVTKRGGGVRWRSKKKSARERKSCTNKKERQKGRRKNHLSSLSRRRSRNEKSTTQRRGEGISYPASPEDRG